MMYERIAVVYAAPLQEPLYNKDGEEVAKQGDWIVIEGTKQFYLTAVEFWSQFRPKPKQAEKEFVPVPYPNPCPPNPCPPNPWPPYTPWPGDFQPYWTCESTSTTYERIQ
jgi:hypothetical protein